MCTAYRASFRHILEKRECAFHPLFATTNAFNISIFETEFSHFFRRVGLGVETVHHCKQNSVISVEEWVLVLKLFTTVNRIQSFL